MSCSSGKTGTLVCVIPTWEWAIDRVGIILSLLCSFISVVSNIAESQRIGKEGVYSSTVEINRLSSPRDPQHVILLS
jgi:hypothetical protein